MAVRVRARVIDKDSCEGEETKSVIVRVRMKGGNRIKGKAELAIRVADGVRTTIIIATVRVRG